MVVFVMEIITLVNSGNAIAKQWKILNKYAEDADVDENAPYPELEDHVHKSILTTIHHSTTHEHHVMSREVAHAIMFRAMREEFINDRSKFSPYEVNTKRDPRVHAIFNLIFLRAAG